MPPRHFELHICDPPRIDGGAVCDVARLRDESAAERNDAPEPIMRAPSNVDAVNAEDAVEFHGTHT